MAYNTILTEINERLRAAADPVYREFQCKLMPTVAPERVIGVRMPVIRSLAKEFSTRENIAEYLDALPHGSYDADNLHSAIISRIGDFDASVARLTAFLPYVDNWATCDMLSPRAFRKGDLRLLPLAERYMSSGDTYTVRFGVGMLMSYFLDGDDFRTEYVERVVAVSSEEYYVRMMCAWYFATALAKQYDAVIPYLERGLPDPWVQKKAIRKAVESCRVTPEHKAYLRTLGRG